MKAVIFDLDGTLIDTEKYYRVLWPKALAHFGYELSDERALMLIFGKTLRTGINEKMVWKGL